MRNKALYILIILATAICRLIEWIPILSVLVIAGTLLYAFVNEWLGINVMVGLPIMFAIAKSWADNS